MAKYTRDYRFKGGNQSKENRSFWIYILLGLILMAAIFYFF